MASRMFNVAKFMSVLTSKLSMTTEVSSME